ncbi:ATP synthase epsilon chain [Mycoplasmopsis californica]|uniref:ATP synthase epsilon chain n=1 Tax=Mycoplasmopsis equigenitalium TaxID=114883 RepID=A0ABY5J205_9BACT|nr:ATP synthase F1 subunit epsilon [Mycoplasmopsis equigenitalium]UUD37287.1 ATP synthase F1 subunit epsilon [Mycoplasmopsis equigenitalium]VEU69403.1 ATP synthase epsilon chain [Mycoplasmopsis californica]
MANKVKLEVITPGGVVIDKEVYLVTVRTTNGNIGLMRGKSPFMGNVVISMMEVYEEKDAKPVLYAISEGIVLATADLINIITDSCESTDQIDINRAIRNKEYALRKIKEHKSKEKILEYEQKLKKEINRINLFDRR